MSKNPEHQRYKELSDYIFGSPLPTYSEFVDPPNFRNLYEHDLGLIANHIKSDAGKLFLGRLNMAFDDLRNEGNNDQTFLAKEYCELMTQAYILDNLYTQATDAHIDPAHDPFAVLLYYRFNQLPESEQRDNYLTMFSHTGQNKDDDSELELIDWTEQLERISGLIDEIATISSGRVLSVDEIINFSNNHNSYFWIATMCSYAIGAQRMLDVTQMKNKGSISWEGAEQAHNLMENGYIVAELLGKHRKARQYKNLTVSIYHMDEWEIMHKELERLFPNEDSYELEMTKHQNEVFTIGAHLISIGMKFVPFDELMDRVFMMRNGKWKGPLIKDDEFSTTGLDVKGYGSMFLKGQKRSQNPQVLANLGIGEDFTRMDETYWEKFLPRISDTVRSRLILPDIDTKIFNQMLTAVLSVMYRSETGVPIPTELSFLDEKYVLSPNQYQHYSNNVDGRFDNHWDCPKRLDGGLQYVRRSYSRIAYETKVQTLSDWWKTMFDKKIADIVYKLRDVYINFPDQFGAIVNQPNVLEEARDAINRPPQYAHP